VLGCGTNSPARKTASPSSDGGTTNASPIYNGLVLSFPRSLVARLLGFAPRAPYFQAEADGRNAPRVP